MKLDNLPPGSINAAPRNCRTSSLSVVMTEGMLSGHSFGAALFDVAASREIAVIRLRRILITALAWLSLLLLAASIPLWGRSYRPQARDGLDGADPSALELARLLAKRVPEVRFDDIRLGDVVDFLQDVSGVRIEADYPALNAVGVSRETRVSFRRTHVSFGETLASVTPSGKGIEFRSDGNCLRLSTREAFARERNTRYNRPAGSRTGARPSAAGPLSGLPWAPNTDPPLMDANFAGYRWVLVAYGGSVRLSRMPLNLMAIYYSGNSTAPDPSPHDTAGFYLRCGCGDQNYVVGAPLWLLWIAFSLLPLVQTVRWYRRRLRRTRGLCRNCGYDLRATPDRCPECGASAASSAASGSRSGVHKRSFFAVLRVTLARSAVCLSLVLCLAVLLAWVLSYPYPGWATAAGFSAVDPASDGRPRGFMSIFGFAPQPHFRPAIESRHGQLRLRTSTSEQAGWSAVRWFTEMLVNDHPRNLPQPATSPVSTPLASFLRRAGFGCDRVLDGDVAGLVSSSEAPLSVYCPHWFIVLLLAILPSYAAWKRLRRRPMPLVIN